MSYELKTLTSKDMFPMFKIISKIGIKEFRSCFESEDVKKLASAAAKGEEVNASAVGMMIVMDIVSIVLSKLPDCENEIYSFLVGISNKKRNELEAMSMVEFTQMIIDVIKKEEFADFIGVVSKSFKSAN